MGMIKMRDSWPTVDGLHRVDASLCVCVQVEVVWERINVRRVDIPEELGGWNISVQECVDLLRIRILDFEPLKEVMQL